MASQIHLSRGRERAKRTTRAPNTKPSAQASIAISRRLKGAAEAAKTSSRLMAMAALNPASPPRRTSSHPATPMANTNRSSTERPTTVFRRGEIRWGTSSAAMLSAARIPIGADAVHVCAQRGRRRLLAMARLMAARAPAVSNATPTTIAAIWSLDGPCSTGVGPPYHDLPPHHRQGDTWHSG